MSNSQKSQTRLGQTVEAPPPAANSATEEAKGRVITVEDLEALYAFVGLNDSEWWYNSQVCVREWFTRYIMLTYDAGSPLQASLNNEAFHFDCVMSFMRAILNNCRERDDDHLEKQEYFVDTLYDCVYPEQVDLLKGIRKSLTDWFSDYVMFHSKSISEIAFDYHANAYQALDDLFGHLAEINYEKALRAELIAEDNFCATSQNNINRPYHGRYRENKE